MSAAEVKKRGHAVDWLYQHRTFAAFGVFAVVVLAFNLLYVNRFGDDIWFMQQTQQPGFQLFSFLQTRYATWSSRVLIEAALMVFSMLPLLLFKLVNALMMWLIPFLLARLLVPKEYAFEGAVAGCSGFCMLYWMAFADAGWVASCVNYIWPFAAALAAFLPLRRAVDGRKPGWFTIIALACAVFAATQEQTAVILFCVAAVGCVWALSQKSMSLYPALLLLVAAMGLVLILACPGNAARNLAETQNWLPAFASYSFLTKAQLGIYAVLKNSVAIFPLITLTVSFVLCFLVWQRVQNWIVRVLSILPLGITLVLRTVVSGEPQDPILHSPRRLLVLDLLCVLLFICLLISLYALFQKTMSFVAAGGILLLGAATKAVMGFSPTIWASGNRTGMFAAFSMIAVLLLLLKKWDFADKRATQFFLAVLLTLAVFELAHIFNI